MASFRCECRIPHQVRDDGRAGLPLLARQTCHHWRGRTGGDGGGEEDDDNQSGSPL